MFSVSINEDDEVVITCGKGDLAILHDALVDSYNADKDALSSSQELPRLRDHVRRVSELESCLAEAYMQSEHDLVTRKSI